MFRITQYAKINLVPGAIPPRINVSQYDDNSRTLSLALYEGAISFTPGSNTTAQIQGTKPDGKGFQYDATIEDDKVRFYITQQMTAVAGDVLCEIVIKDSTKTIATGNFILAVEQAALGEDTDISETVLPDIIDAAESNAERAEAAAAAAEAASLYPPYIGGNEHWYVWDTVQEQYVDSGVDAEGVDGVGIVSIAKTSTVGLVDTYTITLSNGQTQTFTVTNGAAAVLPAGGTAQQVLMKNSSTDSDASWKDINTTASYKDMQAALGAPAGAGKNLLVNTASSKSQNGVTFTVNSDKSITVSTESGGATAQTAFTFDSLNASSLPAGNYIVSQGASADNDYYIYLNAYNDNSFVKVIDNTIGYENKSMTIDYNGYNKVMPGIIVKSGKIITTAITFYPMIRPSGTSADYVPYSESVQDEIDALKLDGVEHKNLFCSDIEQGSFHPASGGTQPADNRVRTADYTLLQKGSYVISAVGMDSVVLYAYNASTKEFDSAHSQTSWQALPYTYDAEVNLNVKLAFCKTGNPNITPSDVSNVMIRKAGTNPTYQKYSLTNAELTERVTAKMVSSINYTCTSANFEKVTSFTLDRPRLVSISAAFVNSIPKGLVVSVNENDATREIICAPIVDSIPTKITACGILPAGTYYVFAKWSSANTNNVQIFMLA